ncbi:MAG: hypothetical protein E6K75_04405 [Candidatus Eisenbacteria bacterium]|uniref:ATP-dependent sacrificial sulfur transferase LarE n=1 Tax=Eiseniibacteriota bacterium TaxID=2212470 RepID=A0A538T6G8_UNCEI|nr:MAG: hypothetical protein E6K75_04405 [Candidatus Eisenbacteria bacterium]
MLRGLGRVLVAYSGGVDSAVLLAESHRVLGERACGVIAQSPSLPAAELHDALSLAREGGFPARVIQTGEMDREAYRSNGPDRCYHCKTELFEKLEALAREDGLRVWDKPQSACLASRIPHGSEVTPEKLKQVELGEEALRKRLGIRVVRLRHEGRKARIEVEPREVARIQEPEQKDAILAIVRELGFVELEIDPRGYRRADPLPPKMQED